MTPTGRLSSWMQGHGQRALFIKACIRDGGPGRGIDAARTSRRPIVVVVVMVVGEQKVGSSCDGGVNLGEGGRKW